LVRVLPRFVQLDRLHGVALTLAYQSEADQSGVVQRAPQAAAARVKLGFPDASRLPSAFIIRSV
jgi:hypothetical protein